MRIFVTHIVPQDKVLYYGLSVAACNFCRNLIGGGMFDKVYSILPTFVMGNVETFPGLVYSSMRNNRLFRYLSPVIENVSLFVRIPKNASVWYYNCTILNATLIVLLKLFKPRVKQQMIILDYTPSKKLFDRFLLWLSNHMHGTIRLANSPLFKCKNSICLPGVVPMYAEQYPQINEIKCEFLISGALGYQISMLPMLLDAFAKLPQCVLHITGNAPDKDLVTQYTAKYDNIIYHGMVSYGEYLQILHATPFLLSTRNPKSLENQCNFPSKIIEGLLHNRILLSTLEYEQIDGIKYFKVGATNNSFIDSIKAIISMSDDQLLLYANQSEEVQRRFGCAVWINSMNEIEKGSILPKGATAI